MNAKHMDLFFQASITQRFHYLHSPQTNPCTAVVMATRSVTRSHAKNALRRSAVTGLCKPDFESVCVLTPSIQVTYK